MRIHTLVTLTWIATWLALTAAEKTVLTHPVHAELDALPSSRAAADRKAYWRSIDVGAVADRLLGDVAEVEVDGDGGGGEEAWGAQRCDLEVYDVADADAGGDVPWAGTEVPVLVRRAVERWPDASALEMRALVRAHGGDRVWVKDGSRKGTVDLAAYADYMRDNGDAQPAYMFDQPFLDAHPDVSAAYARPPGFESSLWDGLPPSLIPEWRWLLAGPPRSGTPFHTDPFNTTAWNALVEGRKLWAFYPPTTFSPPGVYGPDSPGLAQRLCHDAEEWGGPQKCVAVSALEWFSRTAPYLAPRFSPLYCDQRPGDVIVVPPAWWHAVLNVVPSTAVTENSVNAHNVRHHLESLKRAAATNPAYLATLSTFYHAHAASLPHLFTPDDAAFLAHHAADIPSGVPAPPPRPHKRRRLFTPR